MGSCFRRRDQDNSPVRDAIFIEQWNSEIFPPAPLGAKCHCSTCASLEHFAPPELRQGIGGRDYKHSAPPELSVGDTTLTLTFTVFVCGSSSVSPCLWLIEVCKLLLSFVTTFWRR